MCPHRYHMTWFLHESESSLWSEIPNLLVFTPKRTLYFLFQIIFKSVVLSSDYGEPSIGQNKAPSLNAMGPQHSRQWQLWPFSCLFPMSIPYLQDLPPPTFYLTELKSPFEEWLAYSGYSILILEHVISYFFISDIILLMLEKQIHSISFFLSWAPGSQLLDNGLELFVDAVVLFEHGALLEDVGSCL